MPRQLVLEAPEFIDSHLDTGELWDLASSPSVFTDETFRKAIVAEALSRLVRVEEKTAEWNKYHTIASMLETKVIIPGFNDGGENGN
jgi:hypothetical protein